VPPAAIRALRALRRVKRAPRRAVDLEAILACPRCHSAVHVDQAAGEVRCTNPACGKVYPIERGYPHLLLDQALVEELQVEVSLQVVAIALPGDNLKPVLATAEAAPTERPRTGSGRVQPPHPTGPEGRVDVHQVNAGVGQGS